MADKKISELTALTTPDGAEELVVNDGGASKKIRIDDLFAGDNVKANFGAGNDLQIYHDGSHSYIEDQGTGNLRIRGTDITLQDASGNGYISMVDGGAGGTVYLKHLGSNVLTTTSTGIDVTGTITGDLTGDVTGDLTGDVTGDLTGDVTGDLTGDVTGDLTGESTLPAISTDITDTAVDVFVYDTRKDSDGGAWRKRTQHTSWYNETLNTSTRGSRKEFPAVAVIVAESDQVTIYDGDDPDLPMWMVFNVGSNSYITGVPIKIAMSNGRLCVASTATGSALPTVDFLKDKSIWHYRQGNRVNKTNIAGRNDGQGFSEIGGSGIVSNNVNDVAMTVLPNAPIDDATGLPIPTIAVATDGGVSVIKDDGSVVDITGQSTAPILVEFTEDNKIVSSRTWKEEIGIYPIPSSDTTIGSSTNHFGIATTPSFPAWKTWESITKLTNDSFALGDSTGGGNSLCLVSSDGDSICQVTDSHNTGWMNGDIKLAALADTTAETLTPTELLTADQIAFTSDWYFYSGSSVTSTGISDPDGGTNAVEITSTGSNGYFFASGTADLQYYRKIYVKGSGTVQLGAVSSPQTITLSSTWTLIEDTQATNIGTSRSLQIQDIDPGDVLQVYAPSVSLADPDRSVNGKGIGVHGTVTKDPVATGADLVAYSGFSSSNYLEQPYNSDLDFGTGDFCLLGWLKVNNTPTTSEQIFDRISSTTSGLRFYINGNGYELKVNATYVLASTIGRAPTSGQWEQFVFLRRSGVVEVYVNGVLEYSGTSTALAGDVSSAANMNVGLGAYADGNGAPLDGSLSLVRISATAPTAEQIAKIYEDEKVLFQENAKATLYGSSDAVTALAYDDDTNLLHVGTSAGRSDFQGLRRVDNTTTAVGAAISASNGLIAED